MHRVAVPRSTLLALHACPSYSRHCRRCAWRSVSLHVRRCARRCVRFSARAWKACRCRCRGVLCSVRACLSTSPTLARGRSVRAPVAWEPLSACRAPVAHWLPCPPDRPRVRSGRDRDGVKAGLRQGRPADESRVHARNLRPRSAKDRIRFSRISIEC